MPPDQAPKEAQQHLSAARHLLYITFPALKDPKLLLGVTSQLLAAGEAAMEALLAQERELRLVPPYGKSFESKFAAFRSSSAKRNHLEMGHLMLLEELKELVDLQKACPVEFRRSDGYVLATEKFRLRSITKKDMDTYFMRTRAFLSEIQKLLQKYDFNRKQ